MRSMIYGDRDGGAFIIHLRVELAKKKTNLKKTIEYVGTYVDMEVSSFTTGMVRCLQKNVVKKKG